MERIYERIPKEVCEDDVVWLKRRLLSGKGRKAQAVPMTVARELGPTSWRALTKLIKCNELSEACSKLAELLVVAVHVCERSLACRRYDVDKLLINLLSKQYSTVTSQILQSRLSGYVRGCASECQFVGEMFSVKWTGVSCDDLMNAQLHAFDDGFVVLVCAALSVLCRRCNAFRVLGLWLRELLARSKNDFRRIVKSLGNDDIVRLFMINHDIPLDDYIDLTSRVGVQQQTYNVVCWNQYCLAVYLGLGCDTSGMHDGDAQRVSEFMNGHVLAPISWTGKVHVKALLVILNNFRVNCKSLSGDDLILLRGSLIGALPEDKFDYHYANWLKIYIDGACANVCGGPDGSTAGESGSCIHDVLANGPWGASMSRVCPALAIKCMKSEKYHLAIRLLDLCLAHGHSPSVVHEHLASCHAKTGDYRSAILSIKESVELDGEEKCGRWLKYVIRHDEFSSSFVPFLEKDLAVCRAFIEKSLLPLILSLPMSPHLKNVLRSLQQICFPKVDDIVKRIKLLSMAGDEPPRALLECIREDNHADYWNGKLWIALHDHLNGDLCIDHLLDISGQSCMLHDQELDVFNYLKFIYLDHEFPSIEQDERVIGKNDVNDLLHAVKVFVHRSAVFQSQQQTYCALEMALEGLRIVDLVKSSFQLSFTQSVEYSLLCLSALHQLAVCYSVFPDYHKFRYYHKQLVVNLPKVSIKMQNMGMIENQVKVRCGKAETEGGESDLSFSVEYQQCKRDLKKYCQRLSWLDLRAPLCNCVGGSINGEQCMSDIHDRLLILMEKCRCFGHRRLYQCVFDMWGFSCFLLCKFGDKFHEYFEDQRTADLQFALPPNIDPWRPVSMRPLSELPACNNTISMLHVHSQLSDNHVIWIVRYNTDSKHSVWRIPMDDWPVWNEQLLLIQKENTETLRKRDFLTDAAKQEWWKSRRQLDGRVESLIHSMKSFFNDFLSLSTRSLKACQMEKLFGVPLQSSNFPTAASANFVRMLVASVQAGRHERLDAKHDLSLKHLQRDLLSEDPEDVFTVKQSSLLILSPELCQFPWECIFNIPFFRALQFVPPASITVNTSKLIGYVVNPSGDLTGTEDRFSRFSRDAQGVYQGVVGRSPSEEEYKQLLQTSRMFLYFGHGGGELYLSVAKVSKLVQVCPVMLIGCSSAKLSLMGECQPDGIVTAYLKAKSPFIVGNLWDVTDKDIDAFADHVVVRMERSVADMGALAEWMQAARQRCTLKFINGAAPVVYVSINIS